MECIYDLSLKELKKNYDYGDLSMLEYLKNFIPDKGELNDLYVDVCNYNEIFANGWTINELYKMGKKDKYWIDRANNFIKKYEVKKSEYNNYSDFFDKYIELKDDLLDKLGIDKMIFEKDINQIADKGTIESEFLTELKQLKANGSFTVARVKNFCHCVELHYSNGLATIEYGRKIGPDYWESEVEGASWFNRKMNEKEVLNKLNELFKKEFGDKEFYDGSEENEICSML